MSDAEDQTTGTTPDAPAEPVTPVPIAATESVAVDADVTAAAPESKTGGRGWLKTGGLIAGIALGVVIVAGGFFSLGWFTSDGGEGRHNDRMANERLYGGNGGSDEQSLPGEPQRGWSQRGDSQSQIIPGNGRGMVAPQRQDGSGRQQAPCLPGSSY